MSPFLVLPRVLTKPLRWSQASARRARHNAYAANAALAVRRAEREEVDQFLVEHGTPGATLPGRALAAPPTADAVRPLPERHAAR